MASLDLVKEAIESFQKTHAVPLIFSPDLPLYGMEASLDSLDLVTLILMCEEAILKRYGKKIVLANDRALSLKNSPFKTAGSLAAYIETLLEEPP